MIKFRMNRLKSFLVKLLVKIGGRKGTSALEFFVLCFIDVVLNQFVLQIFINLDATSHLFGYKQLTVGSNSRNAGRIDVFALFINMNFMIGMLDPFHKTDSCRTEANDRYFHVIRSFCFLGNFISIKLLFRSRFDCRRRGDRNKFRWQLVDSSDRCRSRYNCDIRTPARNASEFSRVHL